MDIPFTRLSQLSVTRTPLLSSPITRTPEGVREFVENFSAMGRADRAWDCLISSLFYKTSKKELLVAIAVNKVALLQGGLELLEDSRNQCRGPGQRLEDFTYYADLLLSELRPEGRAELLSGPPELNKFMTPFITLPRTTDGISIVLVPVSSWFRDRHHGEDWRLTQADMAGWRKQNDDKVYSFIRELANFDRGHLQRTVRPALCRITHMIAGTNEDGKWPENCTDTDRANRPLCERIADRHLVWPKLNVR
ncbi:hypothetical protein [Pandoraea oxalativorans]|uniref:Uncharacterized protein n=1 Tax=Pandoraea oxalativorans TaxID=573737 RepID=A0A0G3IDU0_9BURK|nr:hypothetical protein [Pandoraea oxalativorans]AKK24783.1 hypothetical protein MB84_28730 [Pandoraea oxalativorans]